MKKQFIILFFVLAMVIGALGYTPWVLASRGLLQWPVGLSIIFTIIGGGSPTFAAIIVTLLQYGKRGPDYLFKQYNPRKTPWPWFPVSILLPLGIAVFTIALWIPFNNTYSLNKNDLAQFFPLLISNFAINMWEEIGWRGYATPTLQRKYSALITSLIVGVVWALWHWPFFAVLNSQMAPNYHNSYPLFMIFTIFSSIIYTWLYNSSKSSLLVVSLFHATTNTVNLMLFSKAGIGYDVSLFYFATVMVIAVILIPVFGPRYLSRSGIVTPLE